jgi:hypothetical protein
MPFSSYPAPIIISTLTTSGYLKDSSTFTYFASPNSFLNIFQSCNSYEIGINTLCTFNISLKDNLNSLSYLLILLPNGFSVYAGNTICPTNGTSSIYSNCNYFLNNSIYINNITNSILYNNTQLSILINITLPIIPGIYNINISSYSPGIVDTSLISLSIKSRLLSNTQFSVSSSSQITYANSIYTIRINLPTIILTTTILSLKLPLTAISNIYCNNGNIVSVYDPNSQILNLTLLYPF